MDSSSSYKSQYLVSILLLSGAYEEELSQQILGSLRNSYFGSDTSSLRILPGPTNRS
jgi:hypothetical protein